MLNLKTPGTLSRKNAGRETGNDDADGVVAALARIKSEVGEPIRELKSDVSALEAEVVKLRKGARAGVTTKANPLVEMLSEKSADFGRLGKRETDRVNIPLTGISAKSFLGGAGAPQDSPHSSIDPAVDRRPGIVDLQRPLFTLDIFPTLPTALPTIEYLQYTGYEDGPDYQIEEGDKKAEVKLGFATATAHVVTIAEFIKVSKQALDDVPALGAFINQKLLQLLRVKTDREVLLGSGATGHMNGIWTQASAISPIGNSPASASDEIGYVRAKMQTNGYSPTAVIINPMTAFGIDSERATGGDAQYVAPPTGGRYFGLTPALSTVLSESQALVVDPAAVILYEREQPNVVIGYENDDFTRNLVTIRAELRLAVALLDVNAVKRVSL